MRSRILHGLLSIVFYVGLGISAPGFLLIGLSTRGGMWLAERGL